MEELAGLAPWPADVADFFERCPIQNRDTLVRAIRDVEKALRGIPRHRNAECGACALRFTLDETFFKKLAIQRESLDAIVCAIRHIHDAIVGDFDSVRRVELLRSCTGRLASLGGFVIRLVPIRAPMTLVRAGVGVEHDDAAVPVTIGHKQFVGLSQEPHIRPHRRGRSAAETFRLW